MLAQLAIKALLVALLPLSVVWASGDSNKYRKLVWITLFLTFDLIMFGAFTRLTDSGLGCPDWPGCYGHANPFQASEQINAAQAALPTGPVTVLKAWIEMIHRYLAMGVGVLIIAIVIVAWRGWRRSGKSDHRLSPRIPLLLLFFVCVQGAFGAWTVTLRLQPAIVTTHLLLAIALLCQLAWLAARQGNYPPFDNAAAAIRFPAALALILVLLQIALGGWVSTNYATLACSDLPLCQGKLIPEMDFEHGFSLWRHLGMTTAGDFLPFAALTAIHWVHRNFAAVVFLVVSLVAIRSMRVAGLGRLARGILVVLAVQVLTGISTVFFSWPLALAVVHNGGAALLATLLVMLNFRARLSSERVPSDNAVHPLAA